MRFSAIHKVSSYLMCAAAFLALALSRELSPIVVMFTAGLGLASFVVEPSRWTATAQQRWVLAWNAATLAVFGFSFLQAVRGDLLSAGVRLICFLLVNKLFNRRSSRDYQHAYVLSLLYLTIFGSIIAFGAYLTLLTRVGAARAGYTGVMIPIVALVVSAAFEGFQWHPLTWLGIAVSVAGNGVILRGNARSAS